MTTHDLIRAFRVAPTSVHHDGDANSARTNPVGDNTVVFSYTTNERQLKTLSIPDGSHFEAVKSFRPFGGKPQGSYHSALSAVTHLHGGMPPRALFPERPAALGAGFDTHSSNSSICVCTRRFVCDATPALAPTHTKHARPLAGRNPLAGRADNLP